MFCKAVKINDCTLLRGLQILTRFIRVPREFDEVPTADEQLNYS